MRLQFVSIHIVDCLAWYVDEDYLVALNMSIRT